MLRSKNSAKYEILREMKTVESSTQHATFGYIKIMLFFFSQSSHLKAIDFINRYNNFDKIMLN